MTPHFITPTPFGASGRAALRFGNPRSKKYRWCLVRRCAADATSGDASRAREALGSSRILSAKRRGSAIALKPSRDGFGNDVALLATHRHGRHVEASAEVGR